MGKLLSLGARLRYPITITKLLKSPGDQISKQESVVEFSFKYIKQIGDSVNGELQQEEATTIVSWESPVEGVLTEWRISKGQTITRDMPCMLVEEACSHEVQYHGLCAACGKDMTEVNWASEQRDTQRATVNMTHDQTDLLVSGDLAARAEHDAQRRLLSQRKLSLVVDLDQTIIHACIEPTIGEWMEDPSNPNYDAVKEVRRFQLNDEGPRGVVTSGCYYYIKMRPGLADFLARIAELYELHVYTMGTRAYAQHIAEIVDPDKKLFGNRLISRDENGSMISKSLQRLFPVSTNMVVIIDDRADVWPRNRPNLIKVVPYDFFKGIGDINSSFLPKRQDILPTTPTQSLNGIVEPAPAIPSISTTSVGAVNGELSKVKGSDSADATKLASLDDTALERMQTEEQERSLEKQITERPLLHMQEVLDKETEELEKSTQETDNGEPVQHRQQVLRDDDVELQYLQQHLTDLHAAFYHLYDSRRADRRTSPVKQAPSHDRPRKKSYDDGVDLSMVPDVGEVLDELKSRVLQDTVIVLSGLVPIDVDVVQSEIGLQASSFGALISTKVSKRVTHLVISTSRPRTQKVRQAARIPSIKIVNQNWLADCLSQWTHLDETPYLVDVHPADRMNHGLSNDMTDAETISDSGTDPNQMLRPQLTIVDESGQHRVLEEEEDEDDDEEESDGDDDGDDEDVPDEPEDGQLSPIDGLKTFDWEGVDDEMKEFLGSDDEEGASEDGDTDSRSGDTDAGDDARASQDPTAPSSGTKRKAADDESAEDEGPESALAKKQRLAKGRGASTLRSVRTPTGEDNESSSLPTPQVTGDEEDASLAANRTGEDMDEDLDEEFDEGDLEADLEAELAAEGEA